MQKINIAWQTIKPENLKIALALLFILTVTFISFLPALENDFVHLDDITYTVNNPDIRSLSWPSIKKFFTSFYISNYHPLTMLSYSLDYRFFRFNPRAFHAINIILHLANCALVFYLIFRLTNGLFIAFFVALFFGVHPLRVESVAWVAARKDVLYAFFFLSSLICYLYYLLKKHARKFYYLSLALFILSCLAKTMAVTLPLVLFILEYFLYGKYDRGKLKEKFYFLAISALFAGIAVFGQYFYEAPMKAYAFKFFDRIIIACSTVIFYLVKLLVPLRLSALYSYTNTSVGRLPPIFSFAPLAVFIIVLGVVFSAKYSRKIVFGSAFFLLAMLPVTQLIRFGSVLAADRYMYIPALGIFYMAGELFLYLYRRKNFRYIRILRGALIIFFIAAIGLMSFLTWERSKVWKNSLILFNDVLKDHPDSSMAYNGRGCALLANREYEKAVADFNRAVKLNRDNFAAYANLCTACANAGRNKEAIIACKKAIKKYPRNSELYYNLGNAYAKLGRNEEAVMVYKKALGIRPDYPEVLHNLASIYVLWDSDQEGIALFKKAIQIKPDFAEAYYHLAVTYSYEKKFDLAVEYCDKAIKLGYPAKADFLKLLAPYRFDPERNPR